MRSPSRFLAAFCYGRSSERWLRLALIAIVLGVTIHLLKIRTARPEHDLLGAHRKLAFGPSSELGGAS